MIERPHVIVVTKAWGAYFKIMRNPKVQHHWAEFVYGDMNYGYGETAHWDGNVPEIPAAEGMA